MSIDWSKRKHSVPLSGVDRKRRALWRAYGGDLTPPLRSRKLSPGGEAAREALRAGFSGTILKGERLTPEEWETPKAVKEAFRSAIDSAIIIETEIDIPKVGK
jgi:hypothetical protein